jgi:hypothetical protein
MMNPRAFGAMVAVAVASAELDNFELVARHYYPAGFINVFPIGKPDLYGFGFGSLEQSYYDYEQKIFYGGSELGFVTVSDFSNYPNESVLLDFGIPLNATLTDVEVCGGLLFASTKDDPNPGLVHVYTAAKRNGSEIGPPEFIQSIVVGNGPDDLRKFQTRTLNCACQRRQCSHLLFVHFCCFVSHLQGLHDCRHRQ